MYQRVRKYTAVYGIPVLATISFLGTGWWSFALTIYAFVWIPFVELFTKNNTENFTPEQEQKALEDRFYDRLLYTMVPLQFITIFIGLYIINNPMAIDVSVFLNSNPLHAFNNPAFLTGIDWSIKLPAEKFFYGGAGVVHYSSWSYFELMGKISGMGICCGVVGINLGHELGHRQTDFERFLAKCLLLTSMYMHFFIEHNRGHHNRVATDEDPATARRGEILYLFWLRSITFGFLSAWQLEKERLQKMGRSVFSIRNEMIQYIIIQIAFVGLIYFIFGFKGMVAFLLAALIGALLLETVNYIEHYGLQRSKNSETGEYEKVFPTHSWNSDHMLGRLLLFELTRHSDHHYLANRKYQVLRHFDESPQMPFGYPSMIILATMPPLWFFIMHKHIEKHKELLAQRKKVSFPAY